MLQDIFVIEYSPFWYTRSLCKFIRRPLHIMARSSFAINQAIFSWPVVYINLIVKLHHIFQDFVSFSYFIKYRDTLISYLKRKK